jgi:hypothetical protein
MEVDLNSKVRTHSRKLNLLLLKDNFRKGKNTFFFNFLSILSREQMTDVEQVNHGLENVNSEMKKIL